MFFKRLSSIRKSKQLVVEAIWAGQHEDCTSFHGVSAMVMGHALRG
jgi:hypothetical protein